MARRYLMARHYLCRFENYRVQKRATLYFQLNLSMRFRKYMPNMRRQFLSPILLDGLKVAKK